MSHYYSSPCSRAELLALYLPHLPKRLFFKLANPSALLSADALRNGSVGHGHFDMRMFLRTKSIFIHIPKAAGRSIRKSLYNGITCSHTTAYWYSLALSREEIRNSFVYTVARNPWSRLHSSYYYLKKGGAHQGDQQMWDMYLSRYHTFKEFVFDLPNSIEALRNKIVHLQPMHHFIEISKNSNILDYVGYYEDLDNSYSYILGRVRTVHYGPCALSHENKTSVNPQCYQSEFTGQMIDIVGRIYERDIDLFGYTFDSYSRRNASIKLRGNYGE